MASLVDQSIASVAALLGDPTRVAIVGELMAGPELSSGSLAVRVGVGPSTTSAHLAKLIDGGLVDVRAEGRTRLYRIASPNVAAVFESRRSAEDGGHATRGSVAAGSSRLARPRGNTK